MSRIHDHYYIENVKTILVGVDMSKESKGLVEEAKRLCSKWKAKLVLAHVIPVDPYIEINFATAMPWEDNRGEKAQEIREFYDVTGDVEIRFGKPDDEIAHLAKKYDNPLILVGHSTKGWLEKLFSGSVSKGLATRYDRPVLIL
jgi:nucleotide-binding universal stress UspA family protein